MGQGVRVRRLEGREQPGGVPAGVEDDEEKIAHIALSGRII
jgi:hypothetical protein